MVQDIAVLINEVVGSVTVTSKASEVVHIAIKQVLDREWIDMLHIV